VDEVEIMIVAILLAVAVMMFAAGMVSRFVDAHPTIKMLALSFLVLVGVALIAEGWGFHIPKGYIYFSMAFAIGVEMLNLRMRRKAKPVHLRQKGRSA
jgi:predicted tellurium resistance membrane protein TerC